MGTGASKDTAATLMPTHKSKKNSDSNRASKLHPPKKGNTGTTDTVRIGLTKLGFSPAEVTVSEGQSISINWNAALGSNGHNVRQVVFDGQAVHSVQGGYNSGPLTQDGNFDIQFNLQGEFSFKSDGYEANSSKVLHVTVKSRHYVLAELTEERFVPSVLHVEQGNCVKWVWNSTHQAHSMQEVRLCPKHYGILQTNGGTSVPMQSGSYKHEFQNPGLFYFQTEGHEDGEMQLCVVHVKATQRHHCVEVTDRRFQPRLLTITQGDRVWWLWDRFKCKKKHRIQQMEVPTGPSVSDPFPRPVKGGFSSDAPSRAGMLSHIFQEPGVFYYCDNNYDDNREYLGVVIVKPRAKEHNVEVTAEGFYPDLTVADGGDRIWWNWEVDNVQDNFSVMQVDSCVASDNKTVAEVDCNNLCTHLTPKAATMITRIGLATVQLNTPGVYHYRVSDTPITVGCCSVIVNPGQKDHCISVKDTGFEPKVLRVHPGDRVWWAWENTKQQHNIFQVSRHGHPTKEGFCSGQPQDSPAAFVRQFNAGAVVYYQSVALPKLYGAVVAVSQPQIHQVLVSKNHLQPDPVLAQTHDCVAWVWPVLRKHGLTQLTNTQQVFELQTYTQDVVTPRRCCALRFSNPGVYHYYSKAFSNKTDKFMYEHSSKTVLSSVVVSNPSGPVTVLVSSKGFKPAAISINRGQGVLWSWKGSHSETHNIVHVNPPSHERPYSPVAGPLAFSSGNPEPNNSFLFTFEEPGTFFETSEGAPGCVGVVHVLDDESLSAMPIITSSSNGGVVERLHNVELQSASQTATILYTLDGSIPELHGQATRVYKSEKGISLRQPGLHIIRALAIDNGALPSKVFTSKRFWVLEGNVGHGSEDDDAVSMATDDLEAEMQNSGPGPTNKWQWWNCVPSISGWLHSGSDNSLEIYWDLPSIPYRGQLKSYQLYVNGICYHNDLPPTCHSITVDGLTGNQTYIISILAQPRDSTLLQQESNRLKVTCPSIYELGGPILSCEVTDQEDTINLVWTSLDYLYTEPTKYLIYVDGRETPGEIKTIGDCKKCQLTLPQREVHQAPLTLFIVTLPGEKQNESDGFLSNELQLPLPLCLDNIHLPNGGSLAGKPFLIIKEGRGKPPDAKADLLPSIERRESFDGSVSTLTRGNTPHEDIKDAAPNRSMECEETFNCTGTEVQTNAQPDTQADSDPPHQPESDSHERVSLPKPVVSVHSRPTNTDLHVRWQTASCHPTPYVLHHYSVCVAGRQFDGSITSHSRQEMSTDSGEAEVQHCWNAGRGQVFVVTGLSQNTAYSVTVNATYHHKDSAHQSHVKRSSHPIVCTTGGPPLPPRLWAKAVGLQEVTLSWLPGHCHEDIDVMGYQLTRNGKVTSEIIPYGKTEKTIKNLKPDFKHCFSLSMVTTNAGQTKASNFVTVTCPEVPDAPAIRQEPSTEEKSAVIVWHQQKSKQLTHYQVYVDGRLHGEVQPKTNKKHAYLKYTLLNLKANGRQYKVAVRAHAGWSSLKGDQPTEVTCGVLSPESNLLTVACSRALPVSLDLRLECIHSDSVDIMWAVLDEDEASEVQGFIILKDDHPHSGSILPPSITHATLSNLKPGSALTVQVLAISQSLSNDSGEEPITDDEIEEALKRCPPNLILQSHVLQVDYDGLVPAPSRIWCELVTSHSFMVVWDKGKKQRRHCAAPESYTVTWWELSKKSGEPPQSKVTSDDHLLIDGLDLGTKYCITVQARGKRTQPHRGKGRPDSASYEVPVLSQTESITVTTASPPEPPSQLTVASVGSNTVQLKWEPPTEKGAEVIGLRVYVTMQSNNSVQTVQHADLLPDATSAIIKNLQESSTYSLHLVTITDEFFDKDNSPSESPRTKLRGLPEDWSLVPKDSIWLPCVSVDTTTTGVSPPSDLSCTFDCSDTVTLNWRASAHEQRTLKKYEVQWAEVKSTGALTSSSDPHQVIEIPNGEGTTSCEIPGLNKGVRYCFTVVAVITELDSGKQNLKGSKKKGRKQSLQAKENLIRLASEPYVIRIPAPCIAPYVLVTGFGLSWVDVYWEKPPLVTVLTNQENDSCSGCIHRTLLGYLLSINGTTYARLKPTTQQYTINCSPGKTYEIGLTAITTTDKNVSKKLSIGGRGHSWLDSAELEGLCDRATSEPLTVTLPKQQSGNVVKLSAEFHPSSERQNDDSDENNDLRGDIHLEWVLQDCGTAEEQGIVGYDITWLNDADVEERVATLPHTATNYDIPVYHSKCVYTMSIHATQYDDMWQGVPTPSIQCVIPGPPDPPRLCCTSVLQEEFILEWGEPRMYGGVGIRGYQVYMNDKKVGQELSSSHYKAAIPCRPNRTYHMSIVALSADPSYRDSDLSEEVRITCWSPETRPTQPPAAAGTVQRDRYSGQGDGRGKGLLCPEDISIGVLDLTETSIVLEWRLPLIGLESQELVDRIKVMWSSVAKPKELEVVLKPTATQYTVRGCMPGTNHFVAVAAMDKADRVLHRSRLVTIQTTAPLSAPHLRIRSCTYSGCILEWDKPTQFGNAHLAGYQLRLNGKDHDRLPAGASTYLFTAGKMCKEYRFTMQALCTIPHLHSQASEPALVTWPGILPPALHRAATTKLNAIRVSWPEPKVTGGAKVEHYKVMCMEESGTGHKALPPKQRQPLKTLGPLPLDQRWAEFPHLSPHAAYTFLLDTQVSGVGKAVRSRPLNKQYVARRPAPPKVRVTVRGLEERRALEMEACQLVNMRHRLLQELISYQQGSNPGQPPGAVENEDFSAEISDALSALAEMEDQLFQVLETLIPYTGTVAVDVEWDPVRESKDVNLSGFKVLVNDKQSGHLLHSHMDRICLQLSAYDGLHKISMVAATDHPVGNSEPSDVTVIDTSPFLPFTCYCLHSVHRNDSRHPQEGCCSYQQTLALEASPGSPSSTLAALHQQLDPASRRIPPASVTVLDVSDQAPHLLVPTKLTNRCPTMLLFWTHWCLASQKVMDYFVDYARSRVGKVICLTCCCSSTESSSSAHLETLAQLIIRRGWKDDALIRHSCSCGTGDIGLMPGSRASSASTDRGHVGEALSGNEKGTLGVSSSSVVSVAELFGILATPMLVILHPEGYLAWQGCFAACNKNAFATMMDETLDTVVKPSRVSSPRSNSPKLLSRSTSVSSCTVSSLPPHQATPLRRADSNPTASLSRNASISTNSSSAFLPSQLNGSAPRAKSARRRRTTPRQKMISVDQRPFSATKENGSVTASGRPKSSITI
ncbi:uncharacterized protein LOC110989168 isoform X4 [Acanthaster planci]|uniref:Uncharacterized protein LOC110989168 isoform X4 n=1 Tax=Acanthaster planci TaxID=133434 RepID=A0A8B7ZW85_ACAPL|nr:uncharacterized protein LOC110989168 isoform X4 [Acanthaster planci]